MKNNVESDPASAQWETSDARFRSVFMHMAEGVALNEITFDAVGHPINYRIMDVNPQFEQVTGLRSDEVVGKLADQAYEITPPPLLSQFSAVALGGKPLRVEARLRGRDYEISIAPIGYGSFATIFSDVTERKRQEQALRENEWFLQQSQRVGRLGSYRFAVATGTWVNSPALDEVFGIDESYPRNIDGWLNLVHPEDRQGLDDYLRKQVLEEGETFDRQYRIVRQNDGAIRRVHGLGALEKDSNGKPEFMIGTIHDITEATLAERALRAKTDELDQFFSLTPDMVCIASKDARLLRVNAAWERVLGWPLEELQNRCYLELVHPDDIEATNRTRQSLANGNPTLDFTNRYRCRDGSYRWIEWRATPTGDGTLYAAARDVTEWIEHERAIAESEERYRLLVETSPFLVAVHEEGKVVFVNRAGIEMIGARSADEILSHSILEFLPDEPTMASMVSLLQAEPMGTPTPSFGQRMKRLDGKEVELEVTGVCFPNRGVAATLLVAMDVSERRRNEQERRRLQEQLQQAQKLESIGRLAGGVAHDFNNLLTVIMSCADSLLNSDELVEDARSEVFDIADAGRRAADLTRQLLAFSRQQVLQPRIIALGEVVENSSRMLRRLLGEDVELVVQTSKDPSAVFADPGQMEQILVNLAVNSRDAMPQGGILTIATSSVILTADDVPAELEVAPGRYTLLSVVDTGIGMDEATRDRAFDPFFTTKSIKGTGLGLATVYGIVKQSGGHIWIQTKVGVGTTVKICLPFVTQGPAVNPSRRPPAPKVGDETILLVEDEEQVRRTLERILVTAGYRVLVASDGEQAMKLYEAAREPIHLLLTDVIMPKMTGKQLVERLSLGNRHATRVLYMSGYTPDAIIQHGIVDEGVEFIQKPLTPGALLLKVREVLDA